MHAYRWPSSFRFDCEDMLSARLKPNRVGGMSQDAAESLQETLSPALHPEEVVDGPSQYAPTPASQNQAVIAHVRTSSKSLNTKKVSRKSRVSESTSQTEKDGAQLGETGAQPRARKRGALKDALADINRLNMELVGLRLVSRSSSDVSKR